MTARRACGIAAAVAAFAAAAEPYGFGDIRLGASMATLSRQLDFRDAEEAVREARAMSLSRPYFGKRGYGCLRRDDPGADVTCVSHEEKISAAETREFRLHFLDGILQQFSIAAEIRHYDAVMQAVSRLHGPPQAEAGGGMPVQRWDNGESRIVGYGGKDLVFVSFELATYAQAVERKRRRGAMPECR
jgi:hypothetical protein